LKTPLHYCKNELICQLLLKKGASPLVRDNKYCTPAHLAAAGSEFKVLEMLLKKANVANEKDCTGKTPLHYAVYNNTE
jgi:ankyrin repeat protein